MTRVSTGQNAPGKRIRSHRDLQIYQDSDSLAMALFDHTKSFPKEEMFSLTSQIRRSSRSVSANPVEAWRKRRYRAAFVSKLSDAETEAAETQVWLEFAVKCGYLSRKDAAPLYRSYEKLLRSIVGVIQHADRWLIRTSPETGHS
jgi:four helix bundle protein